MIKLLIGDCRERLRGLAAGSVQACITSPPYWSLRDYSLEPLVWGGVDGCEHEWGELLPEHHPGQVPQTKWSDNSAVSDGQTSFAGQHCRRCPAWRGSLGLEPTPELFVEHLVEVMRGVRRVLRDDGVLFMNLGDSYATSSPGTTQMQPVTWTENGHEKKAGMTRTGPVPGLKPKDLVGIPWRVAFALQADGWWLRSAMPWVKNNSMPESVTDRPTTAHEYWFLLTKSARYYWDADAVRVGALQPLGVSQTTGQGKRASFESGDGKFQTNYNSSSLGTNQGDAHRNRRTSDTFNESLDERIAQQSAYLAHLKEIRDNGGMLLDEAGEPLALKFSTKGFPGAHFATFPPDLIEPLIKASVSQRGACPSCGAAWGRVVERGGNIHPGSSHDHSKDIKQGNTGMHKSGKPAGTIMVERWRARTLPITRGWQPRCNCDAGEPVPCVVLDPFAGALTTSLVAERLGQDSIAIEQSEEYAAMGAERVKDELGEMFTQIEVIPCAQSHVDGGGA